VGNTLTVKKNQWVKFSGREKVPALGRMQSTPLKHCGRLAKSPAVSQADTFISDQNTVISFFIKNYEESLKFTSKSRLNHFVAFSIAIISTSNGIISRSIVMHFNNIVVLVKTIALGVKTNWLIFQKRRLTSQNQRDVFYLVIEDTG
jgi:hypothetical protein